MNFSSGIATPSVPRCIITIFFRPPSYGFTSHVVTLYTVVINEIMLLPSTVRVPRVAELSAKSDLIQVRFAPCSTRASSPFSISQRIDPSCVALLSATDRFPQSNAYSCSVIHSPPFPFPSPPAYDEALRFHPSVSHVCLLSVTNSRSGTCVLDHSMDGNVNRADAKIRACARVPVLVRAATNPFPG